MADSSYKYVILGGGNAAGYAAREFVSQGLAPGELGIITKEAVVSYERPTLSKGYLNPEGAPRLPGFHSTVGGGGDKQLPEWYQEKGIDYKVNTNVTGVDVKAKKLTADNGDTITYDKLIVATGCGVIDLAKDFKIEGGDLGNILYLRDVADADRLVAAMGEAREKGSKVVVVGGGYIGMEVSSGLTKWGLDVTMVFPEPFMMPRLFTDEIASFYEEYLGNKGVKLLKGKTAKSFVGEGGNVKTAHLSDGSSIPADLVVVGVGAKPNVDLFKGQLDLLEEKPGGIKVNTRLQTSNPDVYAIGDIAAFPQIQYNNEVTRTEHVQNARESGAYAAREVLGKNGDAEWKYTQYFYSRIYDLGWVFYGQSKGDTVFFGSKADKKFGTYWVDGGAVVGGFLEGGNDDEKAALKKLAEVRPESPGKEELASKGIAFATSL